MENLQKELSIIIKEDKGGATVITDKIFYKNKILELLSDEENYVQLTQRDEKDKIMRKIEKLTHEQELTKHEAEYIQRFTYRTSNFYELSKIHKSTTIQMAIKEQNSEYVKLNPPADLKMRPIVAGPCSPTHRLSNFLDIVLKPLCKEVLSYIRDDMDFLNHLPKEIQENTILVSFDVISLYTSIPHKLGLEAIEYWLNKYPTCIEQRISKEFILKAISLVLKENTFKFNKKYYKQIQGTAMGTKMTPTKATLVVGFLE